MCVCGARSAASLDNHCLDADLTCAQEDIDSTQPASFRSCGGVCGAVLCFLQVLWWCVWCGAVLPSGPVVVCVVRGTVCVVTAVCGGNNISLVLCVWCCVCGAVGVHVVLCGCLWCYVGACGAVCLWCCVAVVLCGCGAVWVWCCVVCGVLLRSTYVKW